MDFKQRSSVFLVFLAFVRVYHLPPLIILFVSVHYATKNIQKTLVTTWNYTWCNLDIACNEYLPLSRFV